jgi:hypothetical protein
MFIVLYPMGFIGELGVIYAARPIALRGSERLAVLLHLYCVLAYLVGAPRLFFYMMKQRRKALSPPSAPGRKLKAS